MDTNIHLKSADASFFQSMAFSQQIPVKKFLRQVKILYCGSQTQKEDIWANGVCTEAFNKRKLHLILSLEFSLQSSKIRYHTPDTVGEKPILQFQQTNEITPVCDFIACNHGN